MQNFTQMSDADKNIAIVQLLQDKITSWVFGDKAESQLVDCATVIIEHLLMERELDVQQK